MLKVTNRRRWENTKGIAAVILLAVGLWPVNRDGDRFLDLPSIFVGVALALGIHAAFMTLSERTNR